MKPVKEKNYAIFLTENEINRLSLLFECISDVLVNDQRPDHGINKLQAYSQLSEKQRHDYYKLFLKFTRVNSKIQQTKMKGAGNGK